MELIWILKRKRNSPFELLPDSSWYVLLGKLSFTMSISQIKNLNRRLENLSKEASSQLDKLCGNELWKSIGFEAFDGLADAGIRASANYYYGQFQTARELQDIFS